MGISCIHSGLIDISIWHHEGSHSVDTISKVVQLMSPCIQMLQIHVWGKLHSAQNRPETVQQLVLPIPMGGILDIILMSTQLAEKEEWTHSVCRKGCQFQVVPPLILPYTLINCIGVISMGKCNCMQPIQSIQPVKIVWIMDNGSCFFDKVWDGQGSVHCPVWKLSLWQKIPGTVYPMRQETSYTISFFFSFFFLKLKHAFFL